MYQMSIHDLKQLYEGCLCKYHGIPVIIVGIMSETAFEIQYLETGDTEIISFIETDFDFTPIRIGYINYQGYAYYFVRNPIRQWKQGTCMENSSLTMMNIRDISDEGNRRIGNNANKVQDFTSKEVYNAIMKRYPTLREAILLLNKDKYVFSVAFDTQFAVTYKLDILYRNKKVGIVTKKGVITFDPKFEYLTRALYVAI